jgi:hypothetical protein
MSSILKTGLLGGLLLAIFYDLAERFHFPIFPIHIVLIPGGMMFTINGFLKPIINRAKYTYVVGVCIGFFYALIAFALAHAVFNLLYLGSIQDWSFESYYITTTYAIKNNLPLILISSFLVPLMYMGKSEVDKTSQTDILDQEL